MRRSRALRLPGWAQPYVQGRAVSPTQGYAAYARYYGVDGSADMENSPENEILLPSRPGLVGYASRTGTKRNLAALRNAGWRLLVSATGCLRTEGMPYAIDNGAWTSFQQQTPFDADAFLRAVDRLGEHADWIVIPDIVQGGLRSLEFSLGWMQRLRGLPTRMLLAVQDGMTVDDVREYLSPSIGIFVGGSTDWKEKTAVLWGYLARRRNCYLHIGRVNSQRRIAICSAAGANSFDGTSVTRYAENIGRLDSARRQHDLYSASSVWTDL